VAGVSMGVHALALSRQAFLVSSVTLIAALAGVLLALAGPATLRRQSFPLAFLLLAIPAPWLDSCSPALTQWVAETASMLARLVGIPVMVSGANLQLTGVALEMTAPCSALSSLVAFTVLATLYAFLVNGPLWGKLMFVALSIPISLVATVARAGVLVGLSYYVGVQFALRYYRLWSTALLFFVGFVFFVLIARWLQCGEVRSDI